MIEIEIKMIKIFKQNKKMNKIKKGLITTSIHSVLIMMFMIILSSNISAIEDESIIGKYSGITENLSGIDLEDEAICSEQLDIVVNEYNNLLEEFKNGTNCGEASFILRSNNAKLAEDRDTCNSELEQIIKYKYGFYIILVILIVTGLIILLSIKKDNQ